ncbi:MAG TPA: hypothetical protein PLV68_01985, partial [Ilumatobacteraceae bacterium]|nr:hypothetical protein [Ilumatobacteraceae bacterium]
LPDAAPVRSPRRPDRRYLVSIVLLSAVSVALGVVPALGDTLLGAAGHALDGRIDASHVHLAIWHGFTLELALTAAAIAAGLA